MFLDRQMVLQALYDHIQDKSKVILSKRVERIDPIEGGVIVRTKDGSSYTGDIAIGADGMHSATRNEMWRIANAVQPRYIPANETTGMTESASLDKAKVC
jgi:2-polyprenyl-6-methoxyphenol hydroxylase-like FAD-dependent oxidoreductase